MGRYLIPANAKRGMYIFGIFRPVDLIVFGIGLVITLILIALLPMDETWAAVLGVSPALFCGALVLPMAYYHNVLQMIIEMYKFLVGRRIYLWRGWCFRDESEFID